MLHRQTLSGQKMSCSHVEDTESCFLVWQDKDKEDFLNIITLLTCSKKLSDQIKQYHIVHTLQLLNIVNCFFVKTFVTVYQISTINYDRSIFSYLPSQNHILINIKHYAMAFSCTISGTFRMFSQSRFRANTNFFTRFKRNNITINSIR